MDREIYVLTHEPEYAYTEAIQEILVVPGQGRVVLTQGGNFLFIGSEFSSVHTDLFDVDHHFGARMIFLVDAPAIEFCRRHTPASLRHLITGAHHE